MNTARRIELAELTSRFRDAAPPRLWNVLTDDYFDGRMIPGSRRVPLDTVYRTARQEGFPVDDEVIVYCSGPTCPQSGLAGEKLAAAGYRNVRVFEGGLEAWGADGRPFETLTEAQGAPAPETVAASR